MTQHDRWIFNEKVEDGSLNKKLPKGVIPTPWSEFIIRQVKEFNQFHVVSLVFLFFLFSLYLNNFFRGMALLLFSVFPSLFLILIKMIFPGVYHADSLWLVSLISAMCTFSILVIARVIDVERSRGYDRDICVQEAMDGFATPVMYSIWFVIAAVAVFALTDWLYLLPSLGLWKEGCRLYSCWLQWFVSPADTYSHFFIKPVKSSSIRYFLMLTAGSLFGEERTKKKAKHIFIYGAMWRNAKCS